MLPPPPPAPMELTDPPMMLAALLVGLLELLIPIPLSAARLGAEPPPLLGIPAVPPRSGPSSRRARKLPMLSDVGPPKP